VELEESTFLTSDYPTKLQSSRQYATSKKKTDTQTNRTKQKARRKPHTPMGTLSLKKEARIYNGEKIVSSISDAGRTGQLHVKE